jgi:hypothetical protein
MAIMSIARWQFQPARVAEGIENAKKVKEIFLAGPGEWAMFIRYPDLATMEKAFQAAMANTEIASIFMDPEPPASLTDRALYSLVDL